MKPRIDRIRLQKTLTLSPDTLERIKALGDRLELPESRIVDMAVREMWERSNPNHKP